MDPLSISFGAISALTLSSKLLNVCKFVQDIRHVDEAVQGLRTLLETHVQCLQKVERMFADMGENQDLVLRDHHESIRPIIDASGITILGLLKELPLQNEESGWLGQAYKQLKVELEKETTKAQLLHLQLYNQCLNTFLSTVVVESQWQITDLQVDMIEAVQRLAKDLASLRQSFEKAQQQINQNSQLSPKSGDGNDSPKHLASEDEATVRTICTTQTMRTTRTMRTIQDYIDSTSKFESELRTGSLRTHEAGKNATVSPSDSSNFAETSYDPGFALFNFPPQDILESQIKNYEDAMDKFYGGGVPDKAEDALKHLIVLKEQLEEHYEIPFDDRRNVETKHARILYEKDTPESRDEARVYVERLLLQTEETWERFSLCQFLAEIYLKQGGLKDAQKFALTALNGQKKLSYTEEMLYDSYVLLAQIHQGLKEYPAERSYLDKAAQCGAPMERRRTASIERPSPPGSISTPPTEPDNLSENIYRWLDRHGFDKRAHAPFEQMHPESGMLPVHKAIETRNKEVLREIMESGVDLNLPDTHGSTALLYAAAGQDVYFVQTILDQLNNENSSVDINSTDKYGNNALHLAAQAPVGIKCVELLLKAVPQIHINHQNSLGWTPLHVAVDRGKIDITQALLERQPLLDLRNKGGNTACHLVVASNRLDSREEILGKLLDAGASVLEKNRESHDIEKALHKSKWRMSSSIEDRVKSIKKDQKAAAGRKPSLSSIASTTSSSTR